MPLGLLLLALLRLWSSPSSAERWAGPFAGRADLVACAIDSEQVEVPVRVCRAVRRAERVSARLARAAGLDRVPVVALRAWSREINAYHMMDTFYLSAGFAEAFGEDEDVLMMVLSHEMGHHLQERLAGGRTFTLHQLEAHADLVGVDLGMKAGMSARRWRVAFERFVAAPGMDEVIKSGLATHPTIERRRANTAAYALGWLPRPASLDLFDAQGALLARDAGPAGRVQQALASFSLP